tara:strand:- start:17 stop:493 length:477 start_codon:yes stop_codon:yes gene_type:complete
MKYLSFTLLILFLSTGLWSHGGGLNKDGCHNERKTGGYHCHRAKSPVIPSIPQQRTYTSTEKSINTRWCDSRGGINEFRTKDGTYVDCLTDVYAIEAEFDYNWKEAIGQSLHYAESTNKKAAILFIKRQKTKKDYYSELERVINKYQLPIEVFVIEGD